MINNSTLIQKAKSLARKRRLSESMSIGHAGCALLTKKGNVYTGTSIEADCGVGFCAESSAIAAMLSAGEYHIKKIVAVDPKGKILPPCGRCREVIRQSNKNNIETEILIGRDKTIHLKKLLPNIWQDKEFSKRK